MQKRSLFRGIQVPSQIIFKESNQGFVEMHIKSPYENMQKNNSAFEAWALILRAGGIKHVTLSYEIPDCCKALVSLECETCKVKQHMMRFLFRLWKFSESMNWFTVQNRNCQETVSAFIKLFESRQLTSNAPKSKPGLSPKRRPEHLIENVFARNIESISLISPKGLKLPENLFNQLPIGLFNNKVTDENRVFPTGFIDLWGINKENELWIFELKDISNTTAGIISELFFYANFANQILTKGLLEKTKSDFRGYQKLLKCTEEGISKIQACFLAPAYHKELEDKKEAIVEELNNGQKSIEYRFLNYDHQKMNILAEKNSE